MTQEKVEYRNRSEKNLLSLYNNKFKSEFPNFSAFKNWFIHQKKQCYYCGLTEKEQQTIIMEGKLVSKRFPKRGIISRGRARGVFLEIDRKNPNEGYSQENCVLCCYFCNNDKSDIFNAQEYKLYMKDRIKYLKGLINHE